MGRPEQINHWANRPAISLPNNENGIALILVLIVLLLLSILGATVLTTSTSELQIAGNYKNQETSFFAADSAIDFALTNSLIYTSIIPGTTNSWPAPGADGTIQGVVCDASGNPTSTHNPDTQHPDYNVVPIGTKGVTAEVKVEYTNTGAVPNGSGNEVDAGLNSGGGFKANYFTVSVIGKTPNNSQTELESYVARIIPK